MANRPGKRTYHDADEHAPCPECRPVCYNCEQWQHPPAWDCLHDCAARGFALAGRDPLAADADDAEVSS